jgi:alpha-D-xyloside xylohydrolase
MRPMVFGFPGDPAVTHLDRQYLLGDNLLVAPVFSEEGDTSYYVPAGRWTKFLTGEVVEGPGWVHETHGFASVPLLVRPDSVLAIGARTDRPDYDYRDGITLRLYELAEGTRTTTVPGPAGAPATTFEVTREGTTVRVVRSGDAAPWRVRAGDTVVEAAAGQASCELSLA